MNIKLITLAQAKKIVAHVNDLIKTKIDAFKQEFSSEMQKRPTLDKFIAGDNITLTPDNDKATLKISAEDAALPKLGPGLRYDPNTLGVTSVLFIQDNHITYDESNKLVENLSDHFSDDFRVKQEKAGDKLRKKITLASEPITKDKIGEGLTIKDDKLCSKLLTKDTQLTQDERMSFDQHVMHTDIVNSLTADINILKKYKLRLKNPNVFYLQAEVSFLSDYKNAQVICTDKNKTYCLN